MLALVTVASLVGLASAFSSTRPLLAYGSSPALGSCNLNSILLIAVPHLHASDLAHLSGATAAYSAAQAQGAQTNRDLYLSTTRKSEDDLAITDFLNGCGASLVRPGEEQREHGKTVTIQVMDGLASGEIDRSQHSSRTALLTKIDAMIATRTATLQHPYLIVITSPPTHSTPSSNMHFQSKRQLYSEEDFELESDTPQADLVESYSAYFGDASVAPKKGNSTNIFTPSPKSGLLHRYVFFTPTLIFTLAVTLLLFVPLVILSTSNGIATIATVAGLEQKMTGTVGLDPSKN